MITPIFLGTIESGRLKLDNPKRFNEYLGQLKDRVEIVVRKFRTPRSKKQNNYYWGVVIPILAEYCGYTDTEMHDALKIKFLIKKGFEGMPTVLSTKDLFKDEFFDKYIDQIIRWAAEQNIVIPDPDKNYNC